MRLWIVGSKGMLGRTFCQICTERNIEFFPTDIEDVDITKLSAVKEFAEGKSFSHIINCAAYTAVDLAEEEREKAKTINVDGVRHLASVGKLVQFSTDYVFDGLKKEPYLEEDFTRPQTIYGLTKLEGEKKVKADDLIIRTAWLFSEYGKNFVKDILYAIQNKEEIDVVSDQKGCPTYAYDLAEMTLEFIDASGIIHIVGGGETSWYNWSLEILRVAKELGYPVKCKKIQHLTSEEYPSLAKRPLYSVLNTNKMVAMTGTSMRHYKETTREVLEKLQEKVLC